MEIAERDKLETDARTRFDAGDYGAVATLVVRGYGPEILGYLMATHLAEQDARDVFSDFTEGFLRGLPTFRWHCSLRTWSYAIARNAARVFRRNTHRRERKRARESALDDLADSVRTSTLTFLRTEKKSRLEELRASLPTEDRELLILRLDRDLSWNDLALALEGPDLEGAALVKEAARLRKRFQVLKDRLRELARREGL